MKTAYVKAALAGLLVPILGHAFDYNAQRKQMADRSLVSLDQSRKAVLGSEYLLLSFSRDVSMSELRPVVTRTKVKLTGVYLCADGGGVMAAHLDPDKEPWARLSDPHDKEGVFTQLNKAQEQMAKFGGEFKFAGHDRYCGVDVQGEYEQLAAFRAALKPQTYMTELTSARTRMAAANVVKR
jgi:hypothetical protein